MKISLIIPVFNLENHIEKCLISVENQTFRNFEAIIVNDGSTDSSRQIIEEFTAKNSNFRLINTENRGVWAARNHALNEAKGNYIVFLDGDDYIAPDYLYKLYKAAIEGDADIAVCSAQNVDESGNIINENENTVDEKTVFLEEDSSVLLCYPAPWGKIFKAELFEGLRFPECSKYEDLRLIPKLFLRASKVIFIANKLYYYVTRKGSAMNGAAAEENLEIILALKDLTEYFKRNKIYEKYKAEIEFLVIKHIAVSALTRVSLTDDKKKREVLKTISCYLNSFDSLYKNKYIKTLSRNKKIILFLNKNKLYFVTRVLMMLKSKV